MNFGTEIFRHGGPSQDPGQLQFVKGRAGTVGTNYFFYTLQVQNGYGTHQDSYPISTGGKAAGVWS
jgi:hypothetical protein